MGADEVECHLVWVERLMLGSIDQNHSLLAHSIEDGRLSLREDHLVPQRMGPYFA